MSAKAGQRTSHAHAHAHAHAHHARGRRQSVVGSNRLRKKRDGTPEKSATPSQEPDENLTPSRNIIWNEEIEKLQIKAEDLPKAWPPRPPSVEKSTVTKTVPVQKTKKASELEKPKSRMVSVAKPAPPDAQVKPIDYSGYAGPRYDEGGNIIPHSLLGTYEDFHREATRRGDLPADMPAPNGDMERSDTPTVKYEKKKRQTPPSRKNENNALRNWQFRMMERKRQQGYISKLLQKPPEDLAMNQADNYRAVQEQRYLIDRAIPKLDYGKGYRVGSEFWHQQEQFGDDLTGLHMSLTQAQRGYPPPVEQVGLSQIVKEEKGCEWLGKRNVHVNYPWHKSEYLEQRKRQLQPVMDELAPWQPDFSALQIIGSNKPYFRTEPIEDYEDNEYDEFLDSFSENKPIEPFSEDLAEAAEDTQEVIPDDEGTVVEKKEPVFGPSLLFGGQAARWTGDSFSFRNEIGIEARVTFEAFTGDRITSYLELINDGTTSIYYDWKKMAKENPFDLVQQAVQRFYFNNSSGVILPGETLKFPFVFKSPNAGVFTEQWKLETRPVVCGGAALLVTLRGVALQEDKFKAQREHLEKELVQRQAQQVVSHLLFELVKGIRTPERCRSPVDAYITEEEIFSRNNPKLQYSHELVSQLKDLYGQLFEEEFRAENVWSLSVEDLQESILQLDDDDERKESFLHQMNNIVGKLSYIPPKPVTEKLQYIGYQLFVEAVDRIVGEAMLLRSSMGLPDREQDEIDGEASDSRKGQRAVQDKSKGDAGKDKAKGATKDAKAAKGASAKPDPKAKATPTPAPKKTPTPVKSTAPTPARIPTPGDKEGVDGMPSQPASPDPSSSQVMNEVELANAEKLYRDNLTIQTYDILGEMLNKMEDAFSALKNDSGGGYM